MVSCEVGVGGVGEDGSDLFPPLEVAVHYQDTMVVLVARWTVLRG